jgi:hypothetical protein
MNLNKKYFAALFLVLLALPGTAFAGGFCCQMPSGVQEGISGEAGAFSLRADYTYSRMSRFVSGGDYVSFSSVMNDPRFARVLNGQPGVVPEVMDMHRITMTAGYVPTQNLRIMLSVPWIINDMTMWRYMPAMMGTPASWMRMTMKEVSGLGDVTLIGLYRVYADQAERPRTALSIGAGLKFPTGSSTVSEDGKRIHAHMQPGTGSWDPILTATFVKMLSSSFLLSSDATYHFSTRNNLGYSFGDTFALNANLKYNLTEYVNLALGAGYFHSEQADDPNNAYNGNKPQRLTDFVGYTGEDSIWLSPGVQVLPFNNASIDLRFQYPVYYHVPDIEQVTDWRLTAGLSYSF